MSSTLSESKSKKWQYLKSTVSDLRQFLATGSRLKMMKNAFYFTLKALIVLKMFKFLF